MITFAEIRALCAAPLPGDEQAAAAVAARQDILTKPPGSLGRLEALAAWLGRWQGQRPRHGFAAGRLAQHRAQVIHQCLEATRHQPALRLLIHCRPGRQIIGHPPPRRACLHDAAQVVEHFAQIMLTLARVLGLQ